MNEPNLIQFLLNIAGAAALLIWAVRLVRTGVERGFSNLLKSWLKQSTNNRLLAAFSGMGAAIFLQSSTAVAVLVSNFFAKNNLAAATGIAILLGADLGSAIVTQILMVRMSFLTPLLLLVGVWMFLRSKGSNTRQIGRIIIGLSLIFVSLDMLRMATGPVVANPGTQLVIEYLSRDLLVAFIIGAGFAWIIHSSVAAVLLFVTLAAQSILPVSAASIMILGANFGGALIAYILTLEAPINSRRIIFANLVLRGGGAVLASIFIINTPEVIGLVGSGPAQQTLNIHLIFNLSLLILALPFVGLVNKLLSQFMLERLNGSDSIKNISTLDPAALNRPQRGLDCAARELLGIGQKIEQMLISVKPLYNSWDSGTAKIIKSQDKTIKLMHLDVKLYLAKLGKIGLDEDQSTRSMELAAISSSFDAASSAIASNMLSLARRLENKGLHFSKKGSKEINDFSDRILSNVQLALNVMMNQNPGEAEELVAAKDKIRTVEQKLQRQHIGRLREGLAESIETSNIHQETLRALKQINTSFCIVGYSILSKSDDI
ncbi:Na/Pi cotransporter family protein [Amylibacter sp.]|nr:Na/Pi cotransporter family protein [Amylibacter sp.]MDB2320889.1 Na/Pi cotransporter family protein [Amylibacter sp.]MDB4184650.1 Na/Pi cotransporter family protein [Amylibacter sp.]MDB4190840.1 Na/Pi cotransporter family protein [Amylibacter sp.]MDB9740188.1 Na/Pi cotransporter family protein [Amylibacter sp.]